MMLSECKYWQLQNVTKFLPCWSRKWKQLGASSTELTVWLTYSVNSSLTWGMTVLLLWIFNSRALFKNKPHQNQKIQFLVKWKPVWVKLYPPGTLLQPYWLQWLFKSLCIRSVGLQSWKWGASRLWFGKFSLLVTTTQETENIKHSSGWVKEPVMKYLVVCKMLRYHDGERCTNV